MSDTRYIRRCTHSSRESRRSKFVCRCRANVFFFCVLLLCLQIARERSTHALYKHSEIRYFHYNVRVWLSFGKKKRCFSFYIYAHPSPLPLLPPKYVHTFLDFQMNIDVCLCVKMARIEEKKTYTLLCASFCEQDFATHSLLPVFCSIHPVFSSSSSSLRIFIVYG